MRLGVCLKTKNYLKLISLLCFSLVVFSLPTNASNDKDKFIQGKIIDKLSKEPLVGVFVYVKGTDNGVITDVEGEYFLELKSDKALVIYSLIGYESKSIEVESQKEYNVSLVESHESLNEVVVTGYNQIEEKSFTGNATRIDKEQLLKSNPNSLISALQTFDASFRIQENIAAGADPNKAPNFQIRGQTGIGTTVVEGNSTSAISKEVLTGNSNLPIFILDGFEVDVDKIFDLDLNSVHSVTILKDAAATAMYGSRAANGVIVVERRSPQAGKFRVQYSGAFVMELPDLSSYNLMNASEKLEAEKLAGFFDSENPDIDPYTNDYYQRLNNVITGVDTYWLSQGLRPGLSNKHTLFLDGGENDVRWGLELGFKNLNGVMQHSKRQTTNAGFYVDYRLGGLQIMNKTTYTNNRSTDVPFNSFSDYSHLLPYQRLYDENGEYVRRLENFSGYSGALVNPLYEVNFYNSFDIDSYDEIVNNLSLNWRINKLFRVKGQFSVLMRTSSSRLFKDPASASYSTSTSAKLRGELTESTNKSTTMDGNISLLFNKVVNGHNINACLLGNVLQNYSQAKEAMYRGFPGGDLTSSNYASEIYGKPISADNKSRLLGALLTANYTYRDIYLADLTGRLDGSSEFGADKRWSKFWATGVGLNIHNYDFLLHNNTISTLKARATYGLTGKTNFSLFSAKDMYKLTSDNWYPTGFGVFLTQMGNDDLKWERKYTLDFGLDIGLWGDKLKIGLDGYREKTVDLITSYTIPSSTGFTSYKENMGAVENVGCELDIQAVLYSDRDWTFQVYGNFAHNSNKIVEISQAMSDYNKKIEDLYDKFDPGTSTNPDFAKTYLKYYEGASLTSIYGMKSLGISPTNGKEIFLKKDGDITDLWDANEWTIIGDTAPKGQGSFGCTLSYKSFSMFASFLYTFGADAYNYTLVNFVENADIRDKNVDKRVILDRWQKPGDVVTMKNIKDREVTTGATSRFVQKNNTLQWNSVTINYTFPTRLLNNIHVSGLRLSLTLNDLLYLSSIRRERGQDYPFARSFNFSANISF